MDDAGTSHSSRSSSVSPYGVVQPEAPEDDRGRRIISWLREMGAEFLALAALLVIALFLALPLLLALVAGSVGGVTCLLALVGAWQSFHAAHYQAIANDFPTIEDSAKIAFAGIAYLALLFALNVLIAGLIGRRRQHLYLIPGMLLTFPALVVFTISATLIIRMISGMTGQPELPFGIFFGYAGLAAVVLALLLTDLRTKRRRVSRLHFLRLWLAAQVGKLMGRRGAREVSEAEAIQPLPALHFGPLPAPWRIANTGNIGNTGDKASPALDLSERETVEMPAAIAAEPIDEPIDERETLEVPAALPVAAAVETIEAIETLETAELPAVTTPAKASVNWLEVIETIETTELPAVESGPSNSGASS